MKNSSLYLLFSLISFKCIAGDHTSIDVDYSATVIGGSWSSNRRLDNKNFVPNGMLKYEAKATSNNSFGFKVEGAEGFEGAGNSINSNLIRDLFLFYQKRNLTLKIGKQLLPWGRADRINPTDFFTIRDYRFLTSDDEEQKLGINLLNIKYFRGSYEFQFIYGNNHKLNIFPTRLKAQSEYQRYDQFGLKMEHYGIGLDWSVSYYSGIDRNPVFYLLPNSPTLLTTNQRIKAIGLDFSKSFGSVTFRNEIAYVNTDKSDRLDNLYERNNHLDFVFGAEVSPFIDSYVSVQYYGVYVTSYNEQIRENKVSNLNGLLSNQRLKYQDGITFRFMKSWHNGKLNFEVKSNYGLKDNGIYLAPKLSYVYSNSVTFNIGVDYFDGNKESSYIGQFSDNSAVYSEVRIFF